MFDFMTLLIVGIPALLMNLGFWLLGCRAGWRWLGLVSVFYFIIVLYLSVTMHIAMPFFVGLAVAAPLTYLGGALWHRYRHGAWPVSKTTLQIRDNIYLEEEGKQPAIIWEVEVPMISRRKYMKILLWFLPLFLLTLGGAVYFDSAFFQVFLMIISILAGLFIFMILVSMNRIRYMFGCSRDGFGGALTDPRFLMTSSFSAVIGTLDGNATLAGSGLLASGSMRGTRLPWSLARRVEFDDLDYKVVIRIGRIKRMILYCPETLYPRIRKFIQGRMDEKEGMLDNGQ